MSRAALTVIVGFYDMRREAARTLRTLTPAYQGVPASAYEVVAIDNGSPDPLRDDEVTRFGPNFRLVGVRDAGRSPAPAINRSAAEAGTPFVMCVIDGARMLSPGILRKALDALDRHPDGFVYTIGMHLGSSIQNELVARGHDKAAEDNLLASVAWQDNGYRLFAVSSLAPSVAGKGFFAPILESNCFALRRDMFLAHGGFDEGFTSPGGGLVNPDLFKRFTESPALTPVCLVGEATFHQLHGGVATNVPPTEHPGPRYATEYESIRGRGYLPPTGPRPVFWGEIPAEARNLGPIRPPGRLRWRLFELAARARLHILAAREKRAQALRGRSSQNDG